MTVTKKNANFGKNGVVPPKNLANKINTGMQEKSYHVVIKAYMNIHLQYGEGSYCSLFTEPQPLHTTTERVGVIDLETLLAT